MLTKPIFRLWCLALCCLMVTVVLPGCKKTDEATEPPSAEEPTATPNTPETAASFDLPIFLVSNASEKVAPVRRVFEVESAAEDWNPTVDDPLVMTALVAQLLDGPTAEESSEGYSSAIPEGTRVNSVELVGGTATVDLSREFGSGGGSLSIISRAAQVVFTLTQLDSVDDVAFEIDGEPLEALGGEGLIVAPSTDRSDYADVRPAILITEPLPNDSVFSPLVVRGESTAFEATFIIEIVDASGQPVTEQVVTGGGSMGEFAPFTVTVEFDLPAGDFSLVAYEASPKDGSRVNEVDVPLTAQ